MLINKKIYFTIAVFAPSILIYLFGLPFLTNVTIMSFQESYYTNEPLLFSVIVSGFGDECNTFEVQLFREGEQLPYTRHGISPCSPNIFKIPILYQKEFAFDGFDGPTAEGISEPGKYILVATTNGVKAEKKFVVITNATP